MAIGIIARGGFILKTIFQERILFKCACNDQWRCAKRKNFERDPFLSKTVQLCNFVIAIFAVQLIPVEK